MTNNVKVESFVCAYAIVRFIIEDVERAPGTQDGCHLIDGLRGFWDFVFCPVELRLEDSCRFSQDVDRRIPFLRGPIGCCSELA